MKLFESETHYIIYDVDILKIDRASGELLRLSKAQHPDPVGACKHIDGLVGLHLATCPCLIVITSSRSVGTLKGEDIRKVTSTEVYHLGTTKRHAVVEMLETVLKCEAFYFSKLDISHSLQWRSENEPTGLDENYVWNRRILEPFANEYSSFAIPLIHGFVGIRDCVVNDKRFKLALISRRSVQRAGVRFHTRGLDQNGNCANFVETEQIVEFEAEAQTQQRYLSSFVQIRGSIPLLWAQHANFQWQPDFVLAPLEEQFGPFKNHMQKLQSRRQQIVMINLINQSGREDILGTAFRSIVQAAKFDNVRLVSFDFHSNKLSMLRDELKQDNQNFGFFLTKLERQNGNSSADFVENAGANRNYQNVLFRTNCIDCLDRTNVVQALLAMESLRFQLQEMGIVHNIDAWPTFVYIFKNLWADNGDAISNQYAGTPAQKTDYTRIGRRTFGGALQDGHNSLVRYFKNNFSDGYRQHCITLFTTGKEEKFDDNSLSYIFVCFFVFITLFALVITFFN